MGAVKRTPLPPRRAPIARKRGTPRRRPPGRCAAAGCRVTYTPVVLATPAGTEHWCKAHATREADRLFSLWVRHYYPVCVRCGQPAADCAHIISRRYYATRWHPDNAVGLCRPCHREYTDHPAAWADWCRFQGFPYDALYAMARVGRAPDKAGVILAYRHRLEVVA